MNHHYPRSLLSVVVLALTVAIVSGCYPPTNLPAGGPATSPSTPSGGGDIGGGVVLQTDLIEGTAWQLVTAGGMPAVPGSEATMTLNGGRVTGTTGCNQYTGTYETGSGGSLKFGQLAMTQMACAAPVMAQEQVFVKALGATTNGFSTGGSLLLQDSSGAELATFGPLESTSLTGVTWLATGINNGKGAVASVVTGTEVTAVFGSDGTLTGKAGCNNYSASYTVNGARMSIQQPISTRMFCGGDGVMEQEAAYLNALTKVATYNIDGEKLELRASDGSLQANFTVQP